MDRSSPESSLLSLHDDDSSSSSTDIEDLINPSSSKFSPQLALICQSSSISVPCPEAPRYLNVLQVEKAVPDPRNEPIFPSHLEASIAKVAQKKAQLEQLAKTKAAAPPPQSDPKGKVVTSSNVKPSTSKSEPQKSETQSQNTGVVTPAATATVEPFYPMPGRKFLPHQMPVYRPFKEQPNVLIEMNTAKGPLAKLKQVMTSQQSIKIWTRNNNNGGIRGFCIGIVLAFDKHWNLILRDVYEIFQRKRPDNQTGEVMMWRQNLQQSSSSSSHHRLEEQNKNKNLSEAKNLTTSDKTLKSTNEFILIEGPDALVTLRLHLDALTKHVGGGDLCSPNLTERTKRVQSDIKNKCEGSVTKSQLRKKHLSIFTEPRRDSFGFFVVAQSKHFEIVQRQQKQLFLLGNDIVFIES